MNKLTMSGNVFANIGYTPTEAPRRPTRFGDSCSRLLPLTITDDLFRGFKTSPPDGFSPTFFPPAQRGAGMHVMATEREENDTSPYDLGGASPLPPQQDRGIDPQVGPVTR